MRLVSFASKNLRGVPAGEHRFTDPATDAATSVIVITGPNGAGKTMFLEGIASAKELVAPYGAPPDARAIAADPALPGSVSLTIELTAAEQKRARLETPRVTCSAGIGASAGEVRCQREVATILSLHIRGDSVGKLEYVPAERYILRSAFVTPHETNAAFARARLSRAPDKYRELLAALAKQHVHELQLLADELAAKGALLPGAAPGNTFGRLARAFGSLAPSARLAKIEVAADGPVYRFARRDRPELLGLDDLTHAERQALLFAAIFVHIGLGESIVLIDQPELCLGPAEHVRFVRALVALAPDVQLVLATHSREIVAAAAPHELVRLGDAARGA